MHKRLFPGAFAREITAFKLTKESLINYKFPRMTGPVLPVSLACCLLSLLLLVTGCTLNPVQPEQPPAAQDQADSTVAGGKDAELIALIAGMQTGESYAIDGMTVESGQAFTAASGRLCKYITLRSMDGTGKARSRLACQDGTNWFFATDIFSSEARSNWHP